MRKEEFRIIKNNREEIINPEEIATLDEAKEKISALHKVIETMSDKYQKTINWLGMLSIIAFSLSMLKQDNRDSVIWERLEKLTWDTEMLAKFDIKPLNSHDTISEIEYSRIVDNIDSELKDIMEKVK